MKKISKAELQEIYNNNTNKDACKILGVSEPTLSRYLEMAGIPKKGSGNNRKYEIGA